MTELLLLVGVGVLVAANGFFVAAEFALVRARDAQLQQLEDEGVKGAGSRALSSSASTSTCRPASSASRWPRWASASWASRPSPACSSRALGDALPHGVTLAISLGLAYLITTALHITIGEQVPKIYAITHAEGTARRAARLLEAFRVTFKPLIWP